jgi:hypothetical protein
LAATLTDKNGVAVNLTSKDVTFLMRPVTAATNSAPTISAAASVVNANNGQVSYVWQAGNTDHAGDYYFEWKVTDSLGKEQTYPTEGYGTVRVIDDLESHLASLRLLAESRGITVRGLVQGNSDNISTVREKTDEPDDDTSDYTDDSISARLLAANSIERVIADIWLEKAGRWAAVSNSSNSSTTRGLGSLYSNAIQMYNLYSALADAAEGTGSAAPRRARSKQIVRPSA